MSSRGKELPSPFCVVPVSDEVLKSAESRSFIATDRPKTYQEGYKNLKKDSLKTMQVNEINHKICTRTYLHDFYLHKEEESQLGV